MRSRSLLRGQEGWTLVEVMLTMVILGILAAITANGMEHIEAKGRMAQIKTNMDVIKTVAYSDLSSSREHDWAPMVMPGDPPRFVGAADLLEWPKPPCPGWVFSWDNFYGIAGVEAVRITVRRADLSSIWSFCLENYGGDCAGDDGFGGHPPELASVDIRHVYCNE